MSDWVSLVASDEPVRIERLRLVKQDIAIEGDFELPPLARLSADDQVFVTLFLHTHGSIKDMEKAFGVSYPTIKNRLRRIAGQLPLVEPTPSTSASDVLEQLSIGDISVDEALEKLRS